LKLFGIRNFYKSFIKNGWESLFILFKVKKASEKEKFHQNKEKRLIKNS